MERKDNHISVEVSLKDADSQKLHKKYGVYGCILLMYYDKIYVGAVSVERRAEIIDTLSATKEMFEAMCGNGISFETETIGKLLVYFTA